MLGLRTELSNFTWNQDTRMFITEASTIGLGPGHWADEIEVWNRGTGNECVFYKGDAFTKDGELAGYIYYNGSTIRLKVFND